METERQRDRDRETKRDRDRETESDRDRQKDMQKQTLYLSFLHRFYCIFFQLINR